MNPKWSFKFLLSICLFLSVAGVQYVSAQDSTKFLSLSDAIANSLQNNQSVQLAQQDEKIANAKFNQTQAIYLPQVGFSYTAMSTNNPLNAFGFKLQQKSITMSDFNPDLLNHPNGTPDFTTKLEVMQPIINMDMWYQKKAAAKQTEIYQFQTERTKEYIRFEVEKAYLQLAFAYDAVKVLEDANKTSKAVNKFAVDHFEQGLIQKSDVLNTEVHIKMVESNLAKANSNIKNASDYLSFLMHLPTGVIYKINEPGTGNSSVTENNIKLTFVMSHPCYLLLRKFGPEVWHSENFLKEDISLRTSARPFVELAQCFHVIVVMSYWFDQKNARRHRVHASPPVLIE